MTQRIECGERGDGHLLAVAERCGGGHRIRHRPRVRDRIGVRAEPRIRVVHAGEQPVRDLLERLARGQFGGVAAPVEEPAVLDQREVGFDDHERPAVGMPVEVGARHRRRAGSAGGGETFHFERVEGRPVRSARAAEATAGHVGVERLELDPEPCCGLLGGERGQVRIRHGVLRG